MGQDKIDRREFITGLAALAAYSTLPQGAEAFRKSRKLSRYNQDLVARTIDMSKNGKPAIVVNKLDKNLKLYMDGRVILDYPIATSIRLGNKRRKNDLRTPESRHPGDRKVIWKNYKSEYFLSLYLDYPNILDAKLGLRRKVINRREYRKIKRAIKSGKTRKLTRLGYDICIHGGGVRNGKWTAGCVALEDKDIALVYNISQEGTPVTIVRYV